MDGAAAPMKKMNRQIVVIIITARSETAVRALKEGAYDYTQTDRSRLPESLSSMRWSSCSIWKPAAGTR
jgi:DNA-binding NtrC family response regulator